jgi:hypothetical protein
MGIKWAKETRLDVPSPMKVPAATIAKPIHSP